MPLKFKEIEDFHYILQLDENSSIQVFRTFSFWQVKLHLQNLTIGVQLTKEIAHNRNFDEIEKHILKTVQDVIVDLRKQLFSAHSGCSSALFALCYKN